MDDTLTKADEFLRRIYAERRASPPSAPNAVERQSLRPIPTRSEDPEPQPRSEPPVPVKQEDGPQPRSAPPLPTPPHTTTHRTRTSDTINGNKKELLNRLQVSLGRLEIEQERNVVITQEKQELVAQIQSLLRQHAIDTKATREAEAQLAASAASRTEDEDTITRLKQEVAKCEHKLTRMKESLVQAKAYRLHKTLEHEYLDHQKTQRQLQSRIDRLTASHRATQTQLERTEAERNVLQEELEKLWNQANSNDSTSEEALERERELHAATRKAMRKARLDRDKLLRYCHVLEKRCGITE